MLTLLVLITVAHTIKSLKSPPISGSLNYDI